MKKNFVPAFGAALLVATTLAAPAHAEGWYFGPFALMGFAHTNNEDRTPTTALPVSSATDTGGINGGGGLWGGYDFGGVSLEMAGSYRYRHDANFAFTDITTNPAQFGAKANVQTADLMLSAFYDIPLGYKLQPYIGGGAGLAYSRLDTQLLTTTITDAPSSSNYNFAWQVGGGLKYPLYDDMDLRLDYRYVDLGRIETGPLPTGTNDRLSADLASHDVRIGVAWKF